MRRAEPVLNAGRIASRIEPEWRRPSVWLSFLTLLVLMTLLGCGGSSPTSPAAPATSVLANAGLEPLAGEVLAATDAAIQDEYHAEAVYERVLRDFGEETMPFARIVGAEERHSATLAGLYAKRGLPVPASEWNLGNVAAFGSVLEACEIGIVAERGNIALYDRYLRMSLPFDVRQVFVNNRAASLENHLPAFESCVATLGG